MEVESPFSSTYVGAFESHNSKMHNHFITLSSFNSFLPIAADIFHLAEEQRRQETPYNLLSIKK